MYYKILKLSSVQWSLLSEFVTLRTIIVWYKIFIPKKIIIKKKKRKKKKRKKKEEYLKGKNNKTETKRGGGLLTIQVILIAVNILKLNHNSVEQTSIEIVQYESKFEVVMQANYIHSFIKYHISENLWFSNHFFLAYC